MKISKSISDRLLAHGKGHMPGILPEALLKFLSLYLTDTVIRINISK